MAAPPEGFRPKCTTCGSERVELVPVCLDCPEVARPAASEVTRAAEHIAGQDAGWKDYNATNRAAVTCARAILAGQGAPAAQVVDYEAMNAARVAAQIEGRRLPCPREGCGAKAGEPCGGGSGEWWHAERGAPRHRRHPRQGEVR